MAGRLEGRRVLVVGASKGIGKATAVALAREGARTALVARRTDVLADAVAEVGNGAVGVDGDVAKPADCERMVERAAAALGGLDAVVYAPGITLFAPVECMDADAWRSTFEVNVFGATLVTRAALPHLRATRGRVVFFSSIVIDDRPPRYAMAPYVASKAALESLAQAWQGEHPQLGFTTIAIGDTTSEKAEVVDPHVLEDYVPRWIAAGVMHGRLMEPGPVAEQVVNVLASSENVRRVAIWPNAPGAGD
ncbi:MAG: SDR family oxidoreductase [Myxococcales bacterium]|nr:SDR family oxidoreductase [Myxococcales bacterium]